MKNKTKGLLAAYGMVLPAFLVVMLTVAYPIVSAVIQSFQDEDTGAFTTANYTYFFTETAQRNNLLYTLFVVIVTVVIAIDVYKRQGDYRVPILRTTHKTAPITFMNKKDLPRSSTIWKNNLAPSSGAGLAGRMG